MSSALSGLTDFRSSSIVPVARLTPPDLSNRELFRKVENVPLLDPHWRKRRINGEILQEYVSEDNLRTIAENTQSRAEAGDPGLLFIGHTDKDRPETEQPPLIGYVSGYRIGKHDGKPMILADFYVKNQYYDALQEFPRRSVEVFGKTSPEGYIDSVALLKRAPARDLGLVTYAMDEVTYVNDDVETYICSCESCTHEKVDKYGILDGTSEASPPESSSMPMDPNELKEIIHGITHGVVMGLAEIFGGPEGEPGEPGEGEPGGTPENMNAAEPMAPENPEPPVAPVEQPPEQMQMGGGGGAGMPSGTNTFAPSPAEGRPREKREKEDYMATDIDADRLKPLIDRLVKPELERYAKETGALRNENAALRVSVEGLLTKNRRLERTSVLTNLRDSEGIAFKDFDKELERCQKMSDNVFDEHVELIRENYERSPVDRMELETVMPDGNGAGLPGSATNGTAVNGTLPHNIARRGHAHPLPPDHLTEEEVRDNAVWKYAKRNGLEVTSPTAGVDIVARYLQETRGKK